MRACSVQSCTIREGRKGYSFFRLPSSHNNFGSHLRELTKKRHIKWIESLMLENLSETEIKYRRVCSRHFVSGKPAEIWDEYNVDWVPNLNMVPEVNPEQYYRKMDDMDANENGRAVENQPVHGVEEVWIKEEPTENAEEHLMCYRDVKIEMDRDDYQESYDLSNHWIHESFTDTNEEFKPDLGFSKEDIDDSKNISKSFRKSLENIIFRSFAHSSNLSVLENIPKS